MYRLLIVEDDNNIRKGLIKIINRMDLPVEQIYEAENGVEAMGMTRRQRPHIVITDIKMPCMNGLDFIEQVRKTLPNTKFIILSGYGEFTFAQKAISYNVSEYLLKPVKKNKLFEALVKLTEQLKQEEEEIYQRSKIDKKIKEYHSVILKEILEGFYGEGDVKSLLANTGISFKSEGFMALSLYSRSGNDLLAGFSAMYEKRLNILFSYKVKNNFLTCLISVNAAGFERFCKLAADCVSEYAGDNSARIYSGVSGVSGSVTALAELVRHSRRALDYRILGGAGFFYSYPQLIKKTAPKPVLNTFYEEVLNAVGTKNLNEIYRGIDHLFDSLLKLPALAPEIIKGSIEALFLRCIPGDKKVLHTDRLWMEELYQSSESPADLKLHVKQAFGVIFTESDEDALMGIRNNKISCAIMFIERNYNKNLNLEEVAKHVNVNPSYFSYTFKKETGMCFSDYLQKIRIEKSKGLLLKSRHKIYEIAEQVGFTDEKYYFKIFKRITGVTPNQYRNKVFGRNAGDVD